MATSAPLPHPRYNLHPAGSNFDFAGARNVPNPTTVIESAIHIVKGSLGGGLMGIHCAFSKAGLVTSVAMTCFFGGYLIYCLWLIVNSAQIMYRRLHATSMSYPDVAEMALHTSPFPKLRKYSKLFRYAVDLVICFNLFGACCVYEIMIAKTISQLEHTLIQKDGGDYTPSDKEIRIYILCILLPILLLCMIRSLKYLAPFSLVANLVIILSVGATVYYGLEIVREKNVTLVSVPAWIDLSGFFQFCGVVVFSMECVGVVLPIENNMKHPNHFPIALISGMFCVVGIVMTTGFFGYWGFYKVGLKAPVILNFPDTPFPTVIKGLMGVMIYITFALNFWAPFNLVWHYISKRYDPSTHWKWERVWRAIIIIIITALAIAFPKITSLMGLLGGFCASNMGFIFPALIELLLKWKKPGLGACRWILWKNILMVLLGIVLFVSSTFFNARELFFSTEGPKGSC